MLRRKIKLMQGYRRDTKRRADNIRIRAVRVEARYLKPGDLYSLDAPERWANMKINAVVYICLRIPEDDETELVYRLTIDFPEGHEPVLDPHSPPGMSQL